MAGFQLAGLDPALLEKIISKLDEKSYFRIRQTCRGIDEFIRKNRNISVHIVKDEPSWSYYEFDIEKPHQLRLMCNRDCYDVEALYGIRLPRLYLPTEGFGQVRDFLKKHRLTCEKLIILNTKFTKEECVTLLNILKPISVLLSSEESNRYESVFQSKILREVVIQIDDQFEVKTVVPKFLAQFVDVGMHVFSKNVRYDMVLAILQILCSQSPENLFKFYFRLNGGQSPKFKEIEPKLREIGMTIDSDCNIPRIWRNLANGFVCRVRVNKYGIHVYYDTTGYKSMYDSSDEDSSSDTDSVYNYSSSSSDYYNYPNYYYPSDYADTD